MVELTRPRSLVLSPRHAPSFITSFLRTSPRPVPVYAVHIASPVPTLRPTTGTTRTCGLPMWYPAAIVRPS